jgi:hypothetical protein
MKISHLRNYFSRDTKKIKTKLTSLEWVLFWCFALSEALLKALVQPGYSHMYGFSPVCDLR